MCWLVQQEQTKLQIHLWLLIIVLILLWFCFARIRTRVVLHVLSSHQICLFSVYIWAQTLPPFFHGYYPITLFVCFSSHLRPAPIFSLSFLLLHQPWHSSSAHCTNLLWQWIVSKIIPSAQLACPELEFRFSVGQRNHGASTEHGKPHVHSVRVLYCHLSNKEK